MPCISGRHKGRAAITPVAIIDAGRYREHKRVEQPVLRGVRTYVGLIDTGATTTMISTRVVQELGLERIGRTRVRGVGGDTWKSTFVFHAAIPDGLVQWDDPATDQGEPMERFQVYKNVIEGAELTENPSFDVLIAMDIICTGELVISKDGTFSSSF